MVSGFMNDMWAVLWYVEKYMECELWFSLVECCMICGLFKVCRLWYDMWDFV